jgi:hypothetical protein
VLIDSPELYLSEGDVVPFVEALGGLGADNQFVIATGSRELTAWAPRHAVVDLGAADRAFGAGADRAFGAGAPGGGATRAG